MMVMVIAAAATIGCTRYTKQDGPSCATTVAGLGERLQVSENHAPLTDEVRSNLKAVLANRCKEDRWSADALTCMRTVSTEVELARCRYEHLSQEQGDKLVRATTAMLGPVEVGHGKERASSSLLARMGDFADAMCGCTDARCADRVQADLERWAVDNASDHGRNDRGEREKPDDATMREWTEVGSRYGDCMAKAMSVRRVQPRSRLPSECLDYKDAIMELARCDRLPESTRAALKDSYEQTAAAWESLPDEGYAALATACKSAADAVRQSAGACK